MKRFLVLILLLNHYVWGDIPIFILHSYHESYPWTQKQHSGFVSALNNNKKIYPLCSTEYLDTKRRAFDAAYANEVVHYMKSKYKGYRPKLIYVTDDNALHFMLHNKEKLFPGVPVIFSGINDISKKEILDKNSFTGIYEKKEIIPNLKLIQELFPTENEVLLIGDGSTTARAIHQDVKRDSRSVKGIKVHYANAQRLDEVLVTLGRFKGKAVVLTTIGGFLTQEGRLIPLEEVITHIKKSGHFVILSLEDTYIQEGVLGGYAVDGITQGSEAGKLALEILSDPEAPLPSGDQKSNGWIFDAETLQSQKIVLPEEIRMQSRLLNTPETFFHKHQEVLIHLLYGLSALVIAGSITFSWYLYRSRKIIKERQNTLLNLSESLNRAQQIAHLGNWEWDIQTNVLWWSDEIYRIFGLEPQQCQATYDKFLERVHPEDREKIQEAVMDALKHHTHYSLIHRIIREDGTVRHVIEEGDVICDAEGNPLQMTGIVHDITAEYEREEALLLQSKIFDAVQDSILVHDAEGKFIYLNENAWKTRGYTHDEMMKMCVKELDAPEYTHGNPEEMRGLMEQMHQDGWIRVEVEHLCKNGERLPVEVYAREITLGEKTYVLSSVRDIRERKNAQNRLEESEKKYRDLVENAMIGVYRSDLSGDILYVNRALARMLSYDTPDELIGKKSLLRYPDPKDREVFIQQLLQKRHVTNYQIEMLDKKGEIVPVIVSASIEGDILSGMIIDMRELNKSREMIDKLSKVIEQIDDSVVITDKYGKITYVNPAFSYHTGYTKEEVVGKTPRLLKSDQHDETFYQHLWTTILDGEVFRGTIINKKKNGELYYEKKTISPLKDDKNNIVSFVSSGKDVTQESIIHQEIQRIAMSDNLTGIYNRHKFEILFALESERSRRFSLPLSMLLIDIDHFKSVNDTYGHDVGDEVLKHLVTIVQENIRKIDIFARWGGEEFLVLSPGTDLQNMQILAEKLRSAAENGIFPEVGKVTISIGVSAFTPEDTFTKLFKRADQGLYNAKAEGRNQVGVIAPF
ncbi:ABC transporter substrate binding protein [Sulfuricurvum sp.]|uniref:ABC transporter substrate binding protein n=1 Tax=Sulfuricurvum sp. TaxID=2025608 RepID=UPI003C4C2C64